MKIFLAVRPISGQIKDAMSVNQFLPRPIRLYQAFNSDASSGGPVSNEITRRSFLKRTGGATIATLVAWNMATRADAVSMLNDPSANPADWGSRILICYQDPRILDVKTFAYQTVNDKSYQYSAKDPEAWEKIPYIDCSVGMDPLRASGTVIDWWGQGIQYKLLHWLEYEEVVLKGHYVPASSYYKSTIRSWAAVVEGRWVYRPYDGSQPTEGAVKIKTQGGFTYENWVKTYYMHRTILLVSRKVAGVVRGLSPNPLVDVQQNEDEICEWLPIKYREKSDEKNLTEAGYLQLSSLFLKTGNINQGGQKFLSIASIIPKLSLIDQSRGVERTIGMASDIANGVFKLGASASETTSAQQRYNVTYPPKISQRQLTWGHKTMNTTDPMDVASSPLLCLPNPVVFLPQMSLKIRDDDSDDSNDKYHSFVPIASDSIAQAINKGQWAVE